MDSSSTCQSVSCYFPLDSDYVHGRLVSLLRHPPRAPFSKLTVKAAQTPYRQPPKQHCFILGGTGHAGKQVLPLSGTPSGWAEPASANTRLSARSIFFHFPAPGVVLEADARVGCKVEALPPKDPSGHPEPRPRAGRSCPVGGAGSTTLVTPGAGSVRTRTSDHDGVRGPG